VYGFFVARCWVVLECEYSFGASWILQLQDLCVAPDVTSLTTETPLSSVAKFHC
jgi:hypothetical protein